MSAPRTSLKVSLTETVPWLIFCALCLHLAFLCPYVILFPGSRVNVLSGLLCAVPLAVALPLVFKRPIHATVPELLITLGLMGLSLLSGWTSSTPQDSSLRVMVLMTSGLGGFWCARILLHSEARQRTFAWICTACLTAIIILSLWEYVDTGRVDYFLYTRSHPLIQMLLLLAVGPMALVSRKTAVTSMLGVSVLVGTYITLYLIGVDDTRSAVLIPVALVGILAVLAAFGSRLVPAALVLLLIASAVVAHYALYTAPRGLLLYQEYRVESYPFSWHVAKKHPVLGIGLRTPRDEFVKDYAISTPDYPDHVFAREVAFLVTSENVFLTLMVGLGLPFVALYGAALLVLLWRLVRLVLRPPPEDVPFHPLVLLLPLAGSLLHSLTTDALLYPQVNWCFHVLLGLIPYRVATATEPALGWKTLCFRAAAATAVVALGIFLGTHHAFRPEGAPLTAPTPAPTGISVAGNSAGLVASGGTTSDGATSVHGSPGAPRQSTLVVNIIEYVGSPVTWRIMLMLDNSEIMAKEAPPGSQTRLATAVNFASGLAGLIPDNALVALRSFSGEVFGRKDGRTMPLRVSRILYPWDRGSILAAQGRDEATFEDTGRNNLCAAVIHSLSKDFPSQEGLLGRLVILTDGNSPCSWSGVTRIVDENRSDATTRVDVIGVGMDPARREIYTQLASRSGGIFLPLDQPSELQSVLSRYVQELRPTVPLPVDVRGLDGRYRIMPGKPFKLPPGRYTILLPPMEGLEPAHRKLGDPVKIAPGESRVLTLSVKDGSPVVGE